MASDTSRAAFSLAKALKEGPQDFHHAGLLTSNSPCRPPKELSKEALSDFGRPIMSKNIALALSDQGRNAMSA